MKSKVNQAGVYTKPTMRKALFEKIKAGSKGGPVVKSKKQAVAIALSQAGKAKKK